MNGLYRFFIVTIAALAFCGCAPPIGNIDGSGERLVAVPYRVSFDLNDVFWRHEHLEVFTSYRGAMLPVPIDLVTIGIAEDPDLPNVQSPVPFNGDGYPFANPGRKLVIVAYNKLSTRYWIQVDNPLDLPGPGPGAGNDNGNVFIEWEDDP